MSHSTYNKQWTEAQMNLRELMLYEVPPEPIKPELDRQAAFQQVATMFVKYIQIFRKLEECYDQIVHPQKRRVLRHILDGVMGRILELKFEMVNLEFSEFHYYDDILADYKFTPKDIEIPIPKYFINEKVKILKEREKLLGQILTKMGMIDMDVEKEEVHLSFEDAVRLIQVHERARQGRLRAKFMHEIKQQEERERNAATQGAPTLDPDLAAIRIQKVWKGFAQRRKTCKQREEELIFLGMAHPPTSSNLKTTHQTLAQKTEEQRRRLQEIYEAEYQQSLVSIKEKIRELEGPDFKESMQDQIRQWFIECRDATGKFPEIPDEEDGGSAAIFMEKDPAQLENELKQQDEEKEKSNKDKEKDKKKDKKSDKKKVKKGKKKSGDEEEGWKMGPSNFLLTIHEGSEINRTVWATRDESNNFAQKHDVELIKEEKRVEVEKEVRYQVDILMREELQNLRLAVDRDKGKKKGKKSGKKKKKRSGKKGKKKKKEKDLTPNRTIESLFEELVTEGILVRCPAVKLQDFIGEYSYLGTTLRQANTEPMPSLSDIRRVLTEFAILPLGSAAVHEKAPLVKSILLAGPKGTGKKMLVHAICTETGANLIDLSASNIAGKYPGKDGLKMLMHLVFKIGRALQPTVIFIGNCEKMFKKKVPKNDPTDPKRLKKDLSKSIKTIKAEDQLLVVGTSSVPFEGEMKPMGSAYQKIILIPRPDYLSRFIMWKHLIKKYGGILTNSIDLSSLAKVSDGYTAGHLVTVIQQVLTERRRHQMAKKPLQAVEFISSLAKLDPIFKEEEETFKEWYVKTPLGKKKTKAVQEAEEAALEKAKKDKKGKKKK